MYIWFDLKLQLKVPTASKQKQEFDNSKYFPDFSIPSLFINRRMVGPPQSNLEKIETPTNYNFPPLPFSLSGFVVLHKLIEKSLALDLDNSKELIQTKKTCGLI